MTLPGLGHGDGALRPEEEARQRRIGEPRDARAMEDDQALHCRRARAGGEVAAFRLSSPPMKAHELFRHLSSREVREGKVVVRACGARLTACPTRSPERS